MPIIDSGFGWTLDLDGISDAFAKGAESIILCQPYNPLGRVFTIDELRGLAEVVDRHHGFVVSDEIHGPLVPAGESRKASVPYASISELASSHSVLVSSASKSFNLPGLMTAFVTLFTDEQAKVWDEKVHPLDAEGVTTIGMAANKAAFDSGQEWLNAANCYIHDMRCGCRRSWLISCRGCPIGYLKAPIWDGSISAPTSCRPHRGSGSCVTPVSASMMGLPLALAARGMRGSTLLPRATSLKKPSTEWSARSTRADCGP